MRKGTESQAAWGYSEHDQYVWGYSYEVVVTAPAPKKGLVFPLLASVDPASKNEHKSFPAKIPRLAKSVRDVLLDGGYDGNEPAEALEYRADGRATGRHYVCPLQARGANRRWGDVCNGADASASGCIAKNGRRSSPARRADGSTAAGDRASSRSTATSRNSSSWKTACGIAASTTTAP